MDNRFIINYRELKMYQMAMDSAVQVYATAQAFPSEDRELLTTPLIQATRLVCVFIAQGWKRRRYQSAFVSRLNRAEVEAAATQVWLELAVFCSHLDAERGQELHHNYQKILSELNRLIEHSSAWVTSTNFD